MKNAPQVPTPDEWLDLPDRTVADSLALRGGSTLIVVEGTRRWYHFSHLRGQTPSGDPRDYLAAGSDAHAALIELLLAHRPGAVVCTADRAARPWPALRAADDPDWHPHAARPSAVVLPV